MNGILTTALVVGAVFGIAGNFVTGALQTDLWFVSSAGLIVGLVLLAGRMAKEGREQTAAGFLVVALAEVVLLTMAGSAGPALVFAHGVGLYVPGLLLLAAGDRYAPWVRAASGLAAVAFAVHWTMHVAGLDAPVAGPAAGIGYGLLIVSLVGWTIDAWRPSSQVETPTAPA